MIHQRLARPLVFLVLSAAVLAGPSAIKADPPPIGLTLTDLHAIRDANLACSSWLPKDLSPDLRKLLLERSDNEVVLILLYPDGICLYRGKTEQKLQPGSNNKKDYQLVLDALGKGCFKVAAIQVTEFADVAVLSDNPAAFARKADIVFKAINVMEITEGQKTYFSRRIGQSIMQLPEDVQKKVLEHDQGNRLRNAIEAADQLEQSKLETIKRANAPPATPAEHRILAGQIIHDPAHVDGQIFLSSKLTKEGDGIYRSQFGPGRSVLIKMSPEIAKSLNEGTGLAEFTEMAETGKVEIYFDRLGQAKPTKINATELKATIKRIQPR